MHDGAQHPFGQVVAVQSLQTPPVPPLEMQFATPQLPQAIPELPQTVSDCWLKGRQDDGSQHPFEHVAMQSEQAPFTQVAAPLQAWQD
jgi:hypothetical protein